jgi:hypothetical protein
MNFEALFVQNKEQSIQGRYITLDHIEPILNRLNTTNQLQEIGLSHIHISEPTRQVR